MDLSLTRGRAYWIGLHDLSVEGARFSVTSSEIIFMLQEHLCGTLKVGSPTMQTGRSASLMVILGLISTKRTAYSRHFQVKMYQNGWTFHVARTLRRSLGSTRCAVNQTKVRTEIFVVKLKKEQLKFVWHCPFRRGSRGGLGLGI